jgi:hypothetical protein
MTGERIIDEQTADEELRGCAGVADVLIAFGKALDAAHAGLDWPYFLEKPWKWAPEYVDWCRHGYPTPDDAEWGDFLLALAVPT